MANPDFSISEFIAWARTKPADERYCFVNSGTCALAQFARATGRLHLVGSRGTCFLAAWPELEDALASGDEIFGALVTRLEALVPVVSDTWTRADAYLTDRVEA